MNPPYAALALPLLWACSFTEHRVEEASDEVVLAMQEHHLAALALRSAVIAGDLDGARTAAAALQDRLPLAHPAVLPPPLVGFEQALIQDARAAAAATSLDAVAQKTAAIAAHCGDCHQAAGLSPNPPARLPATTKTGDQRTLQAGMSAHAQAEEQLWRGLMRPALADFRAASNTLAEATILPTGTGADSPLPQEVTDLEVAVHDLAARAARTEAPADRARFYGEILATCGACHRSLGRGPAADGNTASPTQP